MSRSNAKIAVGAYAAFAKKTHITLAHNALNQWIKIQRMFLSNFQKIYMTTSTSRAALEKLAINPSMQWKSKTSLITWMKYASLWSTHVQMNVERNSISKIQWSIICSAKKGFFNASSAKMTLLLPIKIISKIANMVLWDILDQVFLKI